MTSTEVLDALDDVNRRLAAHAGGVRIERVSDDGVLRLAFTGMCAGCHVKPVTMSAVVAPAFERIDGVTGVEAPGTRVSPAALERLTALGASL